MEEKFHTHSENHPDEDYLDFSRETATLLLNVIPEDSSFNAVARIAQKEGLFMKEEFHITLIGRETGESILHHAADLPPEERELLLTKIERIIQNLSWTYTFLPEYYSILKEHTENSQVTEVRKSIIQTIRLPNLQIFYDTLNELLGTNFATPLPHVTLFTTSTNQEMRLRGIGIYSAEQFNTLNPERIETERT